MNGEQLQNELRVRYVAKLRHRQNVKRAVKMGVSISGIVCLLSLGLGTWLDNYIELVAAIAIVLLLESIGIWMAIGLAMLYYDHMVSLDEQQVGLEDGKPVPTK